MPEFPLRDNSWIKIRGARQHNLKNIDVDLPRHQLVVITGVSGSGKSSLAFDTLYAEGQRRYMQSLSVYARQFLDQLDKPDVDSIEGLSPAIAVEQRNASPNPRSTIATATEIHDFLRVLFSAVGVPHDPVTGAPLRRKTPMEIARHGLQYPEGSRLLILAPASERDLLDGEASWSRWKREGFLRVRLDGEIVDMEEKPPVALTKEHRVEVVVDRLVLREGMQSRLVESIDAALKLGGGRVSLAAQAPGDAPPVEELHTTALENPATGYRMETPTPQWFSFNSHFGACPVCQGLGTGLVPDETLLVPDVEKSLADGAVKTWWARPKSIKALLEKEVEGLARHFGVSMDLPFGLLPETFRNALFHGTGREPVSLDWQAKPGKRLLAKPFEGLLPRAERLFRESESELGRAALRRFMKPVPCEACQGARLRPESLAVRLESRGEKKNLHEFTALSVAEARVWLAGLDLSPDQRHLCRDLLIELEARLRFLEETGVPYLTLQRTTGSLSGGEAQRIRLATQIGAGLSGVLYVLDEPSIGLHQSDNERLLATLEKLRDLGNTVVVVEHDPDTMRKADWLIDIGPGAGPLGGELVASGTPAEVMADERSVTGSYLAGRRWIAVPEKRRSPSRGASLLKEEGDGWLRVEGASAHNLKNIDVAVPVGCLTCVTGVSGSGKSTLVDDIIRPAVLRAFGQTSEAPGVHKRVTGIKQFDKIIVIDQAPIGRSPRSNPATYMGLFQQIRTLFTKLPLARMRGYQAGRFSFNVAGGRCPKCEGDGMLKIDMHFLPEAWVPCDECGGKRYNRETLEVTYQGRSVADVLEMDVDEALSFFQKVPQITDFLTPLHDVGLGYVKLGQSATTFSGGEAQRIKLAAELARKSTGRTLYLFDEPTTGLHFQDVELLMGVLFRLRDAGNTLVVVEHNLDVIKGADWIIDLGPGGGTNGGHVVAKGTPEEVAKVAESLTGRYLKGYLP